MEGRADSVPVPQHPDTADMREVSQRASLGSDVRHTTRTVIYL